VTIGAGMPAQVPFDTVSTWPTWANPVTAGAMSAAGAMPNVWKTSTPASAVCAPHSPITSGIPSWRVRLTAEARFWTSASSVPW
jgi:hypothetical protein